MDVLRLNKQEFKRRLDSHIESIYGEAASEEIVIKVLNIFSDLQIASSDFDTSLTNQGWNESDIYFLLWGKLT